VARAGVRAGHVHAERVRVADVDHRDALVEVGAYEAVTHVAGVAGAGERARRQVRAGGVRVTACATVGALVIIEAAVRAVGVPARRAHAQAHVAGGRGGAGHARTAIDEGVGGRGRVRRAGRGVIVATRVRVDVRART